MGFDFCNIALESAVCVDVTNVPIVLNATSDIVNTTIPKHLAAFKNGNIIGLDTLSQISIFKSNLIFHSDLPI